MVLSSYETGRGGFRYGEGLVGFTWILRVAGSPAAVLSQWKVDSPATTEPMVAFHRRLLEPASPEQRGKAMRTDIHFYWAGFRLGSGGC